MNNCPQCGSNKLYKDGMRYTSNGSVQRWLCRSCGYRFSESNVKVHIAGEVSETLDPIDNGHKGRVLSSSRTVQESANGLSFLLSEDVRSHNLSSVAKGLNALPLYSSNAECALPRKGAKNLTTAMEQKTIAGEIQSEEVKGLIIQFMAWLEKEGYAKETKYPSNLKRIARLGANLLDPENVKQVLGKHNIKNGAKMQYAYAYSAFLKVLKMSWDPPKLKQEETLPFIPDEKELDQLIAACRSRRMAAYLQCLKETFADPGEALRLRWVDISNNVITINRPVKGHLPRQLEVSNKLIAMLNALPKTSELVFPTSYANMFGCYSSIRKRAAELQKNPRLLSIELRTFRHWGGTMLAHYTNGNVLTVQRKLGHKRIENTMKYISMIHFEDHEFETATATNDEEIKKLGAAGFQKYDERKIGETCISYYRRPKRFSAYVS
jgi:integrase